MKRQVKKGFLGILIAVATMAITLFAGGCKNVNVDEWFCEHKYNDGIVIVDAGCTTDGALERTCTSCGKKKKEPIIAVGHEFDEGEVVVEPSCTVTGVKKYTCTRCGEVNMEILSMLPHNKITFAGTPATCTETGMTEGYKCADCNTVLVGQSVIPAKGHKRIIDHVVYPTCTETGLTRGSHCEWCGEVFEMQEIMEALGHNVVTVEGYEATCRQPGLTDGLQCDRCNTVYEEQEVIEALEHIDNDNDYVCDSCFVDVWHCNHTYYCHPYSSYERGTNERLNREIRRKIPKGSDLTKYSHAEIQNVEDWLNNYPRQILGFATPNELFNACLSSI